jgi:hypothetical protein
MVIRFKPGFQAKGRFGPMIDRAKRPWMKGVEAMDTLFVSERVLARMVEQGLIGTLKMPGVRRILYSRVDVEALVSQSTRPARAPELAEVLGEVGTTPAPA